MLNVFDDVLFNTHGKDSQLKKYDGRYGTIVRELSEKECDIEDVGRMYEVRFANGETVHAFEDELEKLRKGK